MEDWRTWLTSSRGEPRVHVKSPNKPIASDAAVPFESSERERLAKENAELRDVARRLAELILILASERQLRRLAPDILEIIDAL
jgi:hypothetical protein